MTARQRVHVAASDCETPRDGIIGQPANTVSSLAFVVGAVPIARRARRTRRWIWTAVAASSALVGIGSVGYHGPGGRRGKLVHDVGVDAVAVSLVAAVWNDGSPRRISLRTVGLTAAALALHQLSQTGRPLCACRSPLQGHAAFHVLAAAAIVSAADDQLAEDPPED